MLRSPKIKENMICSTGMEVMFMATQMPQNSWLKHSSNRNTFRLPGRERHMVFSPGTMEAVLAQSLA